MIYLFRAHSTATDMWASGLVRADSKEGARHAIITKYPSVDKIEFPSREVKPRSQRDRAVGMRCRKCGHVSKSSVEFWQHKLSHLKANPTTGRKFRSTKSVSKQVDDWNLKKTLLKSKGFKVEIGPAKNYVQLYKVTFPDGHSEDMTVEKALEIKLDSTNPVWQHKLSHVKKNPNNPMSLTEYNKEIRRAEKEYNFILRKTGSPAEAFKVLNDITIAAQKKYEESRKNPTLRIPIRSKHQLGHLFKSQDELSKAGITFDTGSDIKNQKPVIRHWELDYSLKGASTKNPITRFYTDRLYIGVRFKEKDSWGNWIDVMSVWMFHGKPRNSFDRTYEFSTTKWNELVSQVKDNAKKLNREFILKPGFATSYPIWKHIPKSNPIGLYEQFHGSSPKGTRVVNYEPPTSPLVKIGRLASIEYNPEKPSKHVGVRFVHESGDTGNKVLKSNLILTTDSKGKNLYLIRDKKSKMPYFSERGIIG